MLKRITIEQLAVMVAKGFEKTATKDDLALLEKRMDAKFVTKKDLKEALKGYATKQDLKKQTQELKAYSDGQVDKLAYIIAETVANPLQRHMEATEVDTDMGVRVWHYQKMIGKSKK